MERTKSHYTGVSTFASRTSPSTDQSLQKSFHLSTPKEFQNIFSNPSKKNKTPDTQADTKMTVKLNIDNGLQTRWTRTPAGNMRLASCGVKWLNSSSVFQLEFCGRLTVLSSEIPHERQAQKR
jgi:hypothetical protein